MSTTNLDNDDLALAGGCGALARNLILGAFLASAILTDGVPSGVAWSATRRLHPDRLCHRRQARLRARRAPKTRTRP
ncbi:hypothetical protein [Nonomuraea cavernae]|uniref:hypothetical protein n=1 Tax=Nonomuraea cavernae TaxID=2045107 RepID=UPI0033C24E7C